MHNEPDNEVRWPWLVFGLFLAASVTASSLSFSWAGGWLDRAAGPTCAISVIGVFLYAFNGARHVSMFWRVFRWIFAGVAVAQTVSRALEVASARGLSPIGTLLLLAAVIVAVGWIFVLQWIAMTRLAKSS